MPKKSHPFWDDVKADRPPSPAARLLGWRALEADPGSGKVRMQFEAKPEFTNRRGNVQGGFLAAMLDYTLAPAAATTLPDGGLVVTLQLNVNYVRPAVPGIFVGEGHVVHRGGSIAFVEAQLLDSKSQLIATATSTVRLIVPSSHDEADSGS